MSIMITSYILFFIVFLITFATGLNLLSQLQARQRRAQIAQLSSLRQQVHKIDDMLTTSQVLSMSATLKIALLRRKAQLIDLMLGIDSKQPNLIRTKKEIELALLQQQKLDNVIEYQPKITIMHDDDREAISQIKAIKKIREFLRQSYARGTIHINELVNEDKALELYQLKIAVETHIAKAMKAKMNRFSGSARHHLQKAQTLLKGASTPFNYAQERLLFVDAQLKELGAEVKAANDASIKTQNEKENADMDALFGPKKKW